MREEVTIGAKDHAAAVRLCLQQLADKKCLSSPNELAAIGFKAVHAEGITGVHRVDESVLAAMEAYNDIVPGPQSALCDGDAAAGEGTAGDPAGRGVRDRLSRDDRAGTKALRDAARMGRKARHQTLGLSRRQPSLHRRADGEADRQAGREDHLVPPGRQQLAVCDQGRAIAGDQHGHESADRVAAEQPRRRFRPVRPAGVDASDRQDARRSCWTTWPISSGLLDSAGKQRPARYRGSRGREGRSERAHWPSMFSSPRCGIISARICSCLAGPTPSCSPAASARTRRRCARRSATISTGSASDSIADGTRRQGRGADRRCRIAACSCGSCRRMKN